MASKPKLLIFELDGGSWKVIEPLIAGGRLPHLRKLMEHGASGVLQSESPAISPRIWTTIYTGKSSAEHSVEFFASTSDTVLQKRLWNILGENGYRVGIFGSLVTWPPHPVNGFLVPSIFSLDSSTYPQEYEPLQKVALEERKGYRIGSRRNLASLRRMLARFGQLKRIGVTVSTFIRAVFYLIGEKALGFRPRDRYWRKAAIHLRMTADVFRRAYAKTQPDFATFHDHYCDAVSHRYWDSFEPRYFHSLSPKYIRRYRHVVPSAYELTDSLLGKILSDLDDDVNVLVISDHGFKVLPDSANPYQLNVEKLIRILELENSIVPARFGIQCILYYSGAKPPISVDGALETMCFTDTREPVFKVERNVKYISLTPVRRFVRGTISDDTEIEIDGFGRYPVSEIFSKGTLSHSALHEIEGIIFACGPAIEKGTRIEQASVYDIAPTALYLMGMPVARDMKGRVLTELFTEEFRVSHPVRNTDTYEDGTQAVGAGDDSQLDIEKVKNRLRALGYL